ncbi:MAG: SMP-30/gluconolactonase/LRE family protein [bacterium]|nr:SMP-30/gluconolactonase/LRE family protein [bacterium]
MRNCTFATRAIVLPLLAFASSAGIVSAGASSVPWSAPERVATGLQFTEGPVWNADGFLLFSDVQGNRIVRWTAPDETATFRQPSGNSNGLIFDELGRLVACEHSNRRISRTELDDEIVTLTDRYQGMRLNSPNDIAIKSDGSIYFTDPPYGISPGQQELPYNGVFFITQPKNELVLLASDFDRPNGLAFSPDESKLYIADTSRGHIRVFDVQPDGTLQGGAVFVQVSSPDGMKVDAKGRLYVASSAGMRVFTAAGETFGTIALAEQPSNCCFGDADGKSLFVTARTSLYRVRLSDGDISADTKKNLSITWASMPGKVYSVYRSSDMLSWELAADDVPSAAEMATRWTDPSRPLLSPEVRRLYYKIAEKQ